MSKPYLPPPFPLSWPRSWPRTRDRRRSQFGSDHAGDVSLSQAHVFVQAELERLGATDVAITSNVPTRRADAAHADAAHADADPGIAVWFTMGDDQRVLACDRWQTHAENLRAIGLTVEAMRSLDRWGVGDVTERAMSGFIGALPPARSSDDRDHRSVDSVDAAIATRPDATPVPARTDANRDSTMRSFKGNVPTLDWRAVLCVGATADFTAAKAAYRQLMKVAHPDAGGRNHMAAKLGEALAAAQRELGAR
jgi:DnaJ-domain-containing protein 1